MSKLISKLTKNEILQLPGITGRNQTVKQLRNQLNSNIRNLGLNSYGLRVNQYKDKFKQKDNELFRNISKKKKQNAGAKKSKAEYKESLKERALEERNILKVSTDLYSSSRTQARKEYKERMKQVHNKKEFKKYMKEYNIKANKKQSFTVDIGDKEDKRLAFAEMLRNLYKNCKDKVLVKATTLSGSSKWFTLSHEHDIEKIVGHISGVIDLETDSSDTNPWVEDVFIPVSYEIKFEKKNKGYNLVDGGFFPYLNLTDIDLTPFQIFDTVDKNNYKDNCFVYSIIQSGTFSEEEIQHLRYMIRTRNVPNEKIVKVSKQFKCHFVVSKIYENRDIKCQRKLVVDTRKEPWAKDFKRIVKLILFKNHYMINKKVKASTYYVKNYKYLNNLAIPDRTLISSISKNGKPSYKKDGTKLMKILRTMLDNGLLKELNTTLLQNTCEYSNHLNDYTDLEYDSDLSCKAITINDEEPRRYSVIYYSDFETNVSEEVHKPYLNVTTYIENNKPHYKVFTGENIPTRFLASLKHNSLTWFHNLKYDACFFINCPGWEVNITERNGTILQITMYKYINGNIYKKLTFKNSYSIIPAPLRSFANMFELDVHKEIMAYKLYTHRNISRKTISALEYQIQYYAENKDYKTLKEIKSDWKNLIENATEANCYKDGKIDIIKYAIYYCKKDCEVLMKGLHRFDNDLARVYNDIGIKMRSLNHYISISSIGYDFSMRYGCFDECFELSGKPQNFILRCVSGGRCMTADNEKLIVEGKLQDFDAVSLYPSAMYIMDGVPKGKPKIIPKNITKEQLLKYSTFFANINITRITCKNNVPYRFGQLFSRNAEGSKIFNNEPVNDFYIDKVAFQDLMEFYDFDFEIIRGYYFDQGFNNKINELIETLFKLRLKYKKEKNPLQNTIKLLLNSIYGKSILKAMTKETKCIKRDKLENYLIRNYNYITEVVDEPSLNNVFIKKIKPINNHFNLPHFGASVLSWSKRLMNRVIGTAEQNGISIYYQDTDSMHLHEEDVTRLGIVFKKKYGKELIGEKMTQFHNDFDSFEGSVGKVYSRKFIGLGKKSYLDILVDEVGNEGYHIRLKGIPKQCIINYCKRNNFTIEELYEKLYNGEVVIFNLLDGSNCFKKTKSYQQTNLQTFNRTVKF